MDVDLTAVENAIDGVQSSVSEIAANLSTNNTSVNTDIGFSTFEPLALLAICLVGGAVGWRKVLPGLVVFVIYDLLKNNGTPEDSGNIIGLIAVILMWCGIMALGRKVRAKFQKKKRTPIPALEENFEATNSLNRVLAETR